MLGAVLSCAATHLLPCPQAFLALAEGASANTGAPDLVALFVALSNAALLQHEHLVAGVRGLVEVRGLLLLLLLLSRCPSQRMTCVHACVRVRATGH